MTVINQCTITCTLTDLVELAPSGITDGKFYIKNDRSFMHGTKLIGPFELSASFNASGVATLACIETTTPGEEMEFFVTLKEGLSTRVINFEKAMIPDSVSAELSTITTVRDQAF